MGGSNPDEPKPLSECTVEEIQKIAQSGYADQVWSIGDTYPITLNGTVGAYTFNNETWYATIIGFNHNAELETGGLPSVTFQFGVAEDGTKIAFIDDNYDSRGSSDGFRMSFESSYNYDDDLPTNWESSYMRTAICTQFLEAMPQEWQDIIKATIKYTDNSNSGNNKESDVTATEDKIFLLNATEVGKTTIYCNSYESNYTESYTDYYGDCTRYRHSNINSTCQWWLRSRALSISSQYSSDVYLRASEVAYFLYINNNTINYTDSSYSLGFAPAFTIF